MVQTRLLTGEDETVMVFYDPKQPGTFILPKDNDGSPILQKFLILIGFEPTVFGRRAFWFHTDVIAG